MPLTEYTSGSADGSGYNITIVFEGANWTDDLQQAFLDAADYLSTLILGDLTDITADFGDGQGVRTIDDLEITASLDNIDGPGGILGQAGPQFYRTADFMPITGQMQFDMADAQVLYDDEALNGSGLWSTTVLHEMLHVLGFGTMWELQGLITNIGTEADPDWRFTGANAMYEYEAAFRHEYANDPNAAFGVAVESDTGNPGTDRGHWDEAIFGDEIMTGFADSGAFLSNLTIAALEDMGYQTTYSASPPACFTPGTLILTADGERRVETLRRGDLIVTRDAGLVPLVALENRRFDRLHLLEHPRHRPIRLPQGCMGPGLPSQPLILSPQHRVLVTGPVAERIGGCCEVFVAAKALLPVPGVARQMPRRGVRYLHLGLPLHTVVRSQGAWSESRLPEHAVPCRPELKGKAARALVERHLRNGRAFQEGARGKPRATEARLGGTGDFPGAFALRGVNPAPPP